MKKVQSRTFGLVNVIKFDDTKLDRTLGGLLPVAITFQEAIGRIEAHVFQQLLRGGRTDEFDTRESNLQPVIDLKSAFERNKIQLVDFAFSGQWHYLD
ncbi:hypothetical protein BWI97_25380 [Siphonobacter sp. BAB-5405]|uniref:hypothetical protein n=1 Tax=Siphonobacter sp. BAB-5405 TaxID=1864825 RepID=UPI000C80F105|nr:hypothetical protein [Siphonobacter sp. BAB-5405]PMD88318.1 hypothetical protein BWI97_25380 [Siphonobacter sp. BAB-5405]